MTTATKYATMNAVGSVVQNAISEQNTTNYNYLRPMRLHPLTAGVLFIG